MLKKYKDVNDDAFVKVYHGNKQIYAGLQSMNPLRNLKYEYNQEFGYFECSQGAKKYKLLVV